MSGLGKYPLTEKLHVLGRLGVIYLERERSSRVAFDPIDQPAFGFGPVLIPGFGSDSEESSFKPVFGAGIQYQVFESGAARLEWTRYQDAIYRGTSEDVIDSLTVGLRYSF